MSGQDLCVSRVIKAQRHTVFAAFLDANAVASWLPPQGMTAQVHAFDAREGGAYDMTLKYLSPKDRPRGKTTEDADTAAAASRRSFPMNGSCRSSRLSQKRRLLPAP
jgi:uncharacterized protein YndB with AHSA1/START domain